MVNYILSSYDLNPDMAAKLTKSLGQANALIFTINSNAQISNHLVNEEWGYVGSELATTLVGLAMTAGGSIAVDAGWSKH